MDLLEIRKKAKQQKTDSVPAVAVEPKLVPNTPELDRPLSTTAPLKPATPIEKAVEFDAAPEFDSIAQDFGAFLLAQESQAAKADVFDKKTPPPVSPAPVSPAPRERDLDLANLAMDLGHANQQPQFDSGRIESAFLDLATEELYRHSYLDSEITEEVELSELLSCTIADEHYGVNIHKIKEIIKMREITEVPRAPKFILGIITLRGRVIPIFDLRERLSLEAKPFSRHTKIVVVHQKEELYGLIVDAVIDVARFPKSSIEPTPQVMVGVEAKYIEGIGRIGDEMIILLNLEEVLSLEAVAA